MTQPASSLPHILLDFDGTVTTRDSVDAVLERFALPAWRDVEEEWERGEIGSRECLERQVALIRATPSAMDQFIDRIEVDASFADLLMLCRRMGANIEVVSDGFERSVRRVLERVGAHCAIKANLLLPTGHDRWSLLSPFSQTDCRSGAGTCKCRAASERGSILIGDGRSDFCVAKEASFVFAKGRLADYCRDNAIPHTAIRHLGDVLQPLARRLAIDVAA
jgi:2-hydroxy-3-keto-5-methylthiopentenyl-1-phosphate phosphatase